MPFEFLRLQWSLQGKTGRSRGNKFHKVLKNGDGPVIFLQFSAKQSLRYAAGPCYI
jgi:hypothetical protein